MSPVVPAAITGAAGAAAFMAWAVRGRSSTVFGPSDWRGADNRPSIALTFDDGPSEQTPHLLEILARYDVPATFFQCGVNVLRLPRIARAVREAGHDIGNHSHSHPLFCFRDSRFMTNELHNAQEAIRDATGVIPDLFRPPFGVRWFGLRAAMRRNKLHGVMWTAIGYDWNQKSELVLDRMSRKASPGAILCLHDGRELEQHPEIGVTLDVVRRLIPILRDRGFQFVTVDRLLCQKISHNEFSK